MVQAVILASPESMKTPLTDLAATQLSRKSFPPVATKPLPLRSNADVLWIVMSVPTFARAPIGLCDRTLASIAMLTAPALPDAQTALRALLSSVLFRSEERRVGKAGRS